MVFGVKVDTGCVVKTGGEFGSTVAVDVMVLVVIRVVVADVRESTVLVGVTEDTIGGVEVTSDVTDSIDTSLVGVNVVFQVDVA